MRIAVGADHNAFDLKESVKAYITSLGHEVVDYGCYSKDEIDYPGVAFKVAGEINNGTVERGILFCGTGIGMAIAANKVPGIRAAQCHDVYSAERAQLSNNAQIITMGAKVIGEEAAKKVAKAYLNVTFQGGNSARKIDQIMEKESENLIQGANAGC
ncbi:ribose 5-phosphate isomerase B [Weizmannia coagulans]|uniref:RpiB/LacA/LacB family sugar-phosphate isomerase n=2 Tax=Heyndrickxia TaxID=2837504 RepID=A0AAN0T496_HEYCO|nr:MULTISPECIES: ribose 5-phosphate isomerase B [Heyndrickxia]AJO21490.1 RpiB/LacA/LacB family sugar-phosphate isomerase [Heyndrickxia coagulans]APB37289.1 ribose 5-phosphate isomerase B [Heyndrickxia coagulans]ATW82060.1 RpiB/LacA/LacB family sugar-phosphate isomerase [Heyndrickxia coagulans]KGB29463.1 sugar phosphate isomerase [Heyndrickxia coagulans]KXT20443.1 sugar phosphate isomerase [Heyndrickxia coagulans]